MTTQSTDEITEYALAAIWVKPKERSEYKVYARSREDTEAIVRLQFPQRHTKDCELLAVIDAGEIYGK